MAAEFVRSHILFAAPANLSYTRGLERHPPERYLGRIPENHQLQFRWEVVNVTSPEDGRI